MLISGRKNQTDSDYGFSLLEILVVLAIMGTMLSIVSVRMVQTMQSAYFSKTADAAIADIVSLRADAMLSRDTRILITDSTRIQEFPEHMRNKIRRLDIPDDWRASGEPIHISGAGTCFGGAILIENAEGRRAIFDLQPPKCQLKRSDLLPAEIAARAQVSQ